MLKHMLGSFILRGIQTGMSLLVHGVEDPL